VGSLFRVFLCVWGHFALVSGRVRTCLGLSPDTPNVGRSRRAF
jgi:hypothetical protein